jgi:hypothetical protein
MPNYYTGSINTFTASIPAPAIGEQVTAQSVDDGMRALADRTSYTQNYIENTYDPIFQYAETEVNFNYRDLNVINSITVDYTGSNNNFSFSNNGSEKLTLNSNGNIYASGTIYSTGSVVIKNNLLVTGTVAATSLDTQYRKTKWCEVKLSGANIAFGDELTHTLGMYNGNWSLSSNKIVFPETGYYKLELNCMIILDSASDGIQGVLLIRKNGSANYVGAAHARRWSTFNTEAFSLSTCAVVNIANTANDTIYVTNGNVTINSIADIWNSPEYNNCRLIITKLSD